MMLSGFRLLTLPKLPWFKFLQRHLDWLNVSLSNGVLRGPGASDLPAAWLGPARKQLDSSELKRGCAITWDVPKAVLEAAMNGGPHEEVLSPSIYVSGTGLRLMLKPKAKEGDAVAYGVYMRTSSYTQHGTILTEGADAFSCQYEVQRQEPGQVQLCRVTKGQATFIKCGWGVRGAIVASSPADLEPHLVDGHLKLKATISMIPA
jgi:hypothetical protein